MKKNSVLRLVSALLVLASLCALFSSCANKLKMKNEKFVSSETGVEYSVVRNVYLPRAISDEVYAVFMKNGVEIEYFAVEGLPPEEWLVSEYGDLLYAGDVNSLPELPEFGATEMLVCYNSDVLFSLIDETREEKVKSIVDCYSTVTPVEKNYDNYNAYKLFFASEKYPALYFQLKLAVTEDKFYLVDTSIGANYDVTDLFSGYVDLAFHDDGSGE